MNLPSTSFLCEVARIGDMLIVNWSLTAPIGSSAHQKGELVIKNEEFENWLMLAASKIKSTVP